MAQQEFKVDWFGLSQMVAYFAVLLFSFFTVIKKTPIWSGVKTARANKHGTVYFPVCCLLIQSLVSLLYTWYYIFKFVFEDIARFETFDEWLEKGEMFFNAYVMVVGSDGRWIWTSGLLFWVLIGVSFMTLEGKRLNIRYIWAYVVIGFLGAISVSFTLFYSHILIQEYLIAMDKSSRKGDRRAGSEKDAIRFPALLFFCVVIAGVATVGLPISLKAGDKQSFNICLLIVHGILFAPAVICAPTFNSTCDVKLIRRKMSPQYIKFIQMIAIVSTALYYCYIFEFYQPYIRKYGILGFNFKDATLDLYNEIWLNSCQISITADLFSTVLATLVLITSETDSIASQLQFIVTAVLLSPATATGIYIWERENRSVSERAYLQPVYKKKE